MMFWPVGGPQPPTLAAEAISPTEAELSWSDQSGGRARYEVRRDDELIATTAAGAETFTDEEATPEATHEYGVRAVAPYWTAVAGPTDSVTMPAETGVTGLLFPDYDVSPSGNKMIVLWNAGEGSTAPFPIYGGATYIWRAFPMAKVVNPLGYWSSLFRAQWGLPWEDGAVNYEYYGCHPYPDGPDNRAEWEISINGIDERVVPVEYDRWHTQVVTATTGKVVTFYFDWLAGIGAGFRVGPITQNAKTAQDDPAMWFGDTLWTQERYRGILRGFQYYDAVLTEEQINSEIATPGSVRTPWYLNLNPTPDDISDKSGAGHNPKWYSAAKASLWEGP